LVRYAVPKSRAFLFKFHPFSAPTEAGKNLGCGNLTVVALEEETIEMGGRRINVVPLWKFLLGVR